MPTRGPKSGPDMRKWLTASIVLHIALLAAILVTLPHMTDEVDMTQQIIPVDIVNIADLTVTKVDDKPQPAPTPEATQTEQPKPQPTPQEKPEPKPEPPKPAETPAPTPDAETIPDKTKPPEKPKEQPKDQPKPPEKPPEKPKDQPKFSLQNVLKNVEKMKDTAPPAPQPQPNAKPSDKPVVSQQPAASGAQLSMSEVDALRQQIIPCWNVPIGARGIENMNVELSIDVNEDRTVQNVEVVDKMRMISDSYFRTMAESAVRAVKNPRCSPLKLPPDKYSEWKHFTMIFNAKDML